MGPVRILVTGSRDWDDVATIIAALDERSQCGRIPTVVVHGHCPTGADRIADEWVEAQHDQPFDSPVRVERHPADWTRHDEDCPPSHAGLRVCRRAGFRRNAEMVDIGADVCLAFIKNGSRGASHTARLAEQAGIVTRRFTA